jgi:hypothetical protein
MGLYDFRIKNKLGQTLATLEGATGRSFGTYLNKAGEARFSLSPTDPKLTGDLLLLGSKELTIYRAGTLVWGGELCYSRLDLSREDERMELAAKGYLDLLGKRVVGTASTPRVFENTDLVTIARTLVDETQLQPDGDFGITLGLNPTSRPADRSDYYYTNLLEAIEGLSNEKVTNGIDFEITPDKKFNCYYPTKGRELPEIVFEWGVNITSFWETLDATELANQVIVLGAGEGSSMATATRNASDYLQETYKLRQSVISEKTITGTETLEKHGDRELAEKQTHRQIIGVTVKGNVSPGFGSYAVGDRVRVKVRRGITNIDAFYRIYGIYVSITDKDEETITVIFNAD